MYYLSTLFAGYNPGVSTRLVLDSGPAIFVNLTDPNTNRDPTSAGDPKPAVRWGISGMSNGTHKLVVSLGPTSDGQVATWGEVDAFM